MASDDELEEAERLFALQQAKLEALRAAKREKQLREEQQNSGLLVPASPSPTKKRKTTLGNLGDARPAKTQKRPSTSLFATGKKASIQDNDQQRLAPQRVTGSSTLLADFTQGQNRLKESADRRTVQRSTTFGQVAPKREAPPPVQAKNDKGKARAVEQNDRREEAEEDISIGNKRNEDLTLVHDLQPGPREFKTPIGDPEWKSFEPNSGIRLQKRTLPHEELQEYLSDRYHIPPELLYSLVRKTKGGTEYELPVEGDWIVIGVLAEKSEIRTTGQSNYTAQASAEALRKKNKEKKEKAKLKAAAKKNKENGGDGGIDNLIYNEAESDKELKSSDAENDFDDDEEEGGNGYKPQARKYISFKLIDLRLKGAGGGTGILNLKLFESDPEKSRRKATHLTAGDEGTVITKKGVRYEKENADDGTSSTSVRTEYKGGSGGAFEKFWKERNGTVIAILNPRIMKPWQSAYQNNENANIISITPDSADSILVIGKAKDLGSCTAMKRDGKLCGAWCDTRQNQVCDFHVQKAVKNKRAGRAEFFAGTSGMEATSVTSAFKNRMQQHRQAGVASSIANGGTGVPRQTSSIPSYKANSSRLTSYDPVTKTGLLPRDNISNVDGSKTYVVGSTGSIAPSSRFGGRNSKFIDGPPVAKELDPKAKAEKKAREERHLQRFLGRDGGKTLGAKYLVSNGKAKLERPVKRESRDGMTGTESEDTDDAGGRGGKKRVFDVAAVRRIGWDPSSLNMDSASKLAKQRQLEASNLLGTAPRPAPKLGPAPGAKVRSGVSVPAGAVSEQPRLPATTDDWDNLDDFDNFHYNDDDTAQRRAFVDDCDMPEQMEMEDTGYLFSSDEEQEMAPMKRVCVYDEPHGQGDEDGDDGDDDDLEIEPPTTA